MLVSSTSRQNLTLKTQNSKCHWVDPVPPVSTNPRKAVLISTTFQVQNPRKAVVLISTTFQVQNNRNVVLISTTFQVQNDPETSYKVYSTIPATDTATYLVEPS
jgi:hypothetical protein